MQTPSYKPLNIGSFTVPFPVVLAPMAGYTDLAFRSMCKEFHCGLTFTEVINAAGIVHGSLPTFHLLETNPAERPVVAHLYGAEPEIMAEAASIIEEREGFDLIDINAGCPVRKIVAKGCGVALMRDPDKVRRIVQAIREAVSLPVTIKTRSGFSEDTINVSEVAQAAEEGGASAISIHPRLAVRKHSGPADWEIFSRIKSERALSVIGNGGVTKPEQALKMIQSTGVDGVMIGRGAIGNPWIFEGIRGLITGKDIRQHTLEEHRKIILEHLQRLVSLKTHHPKYRKKRAKIGPEAAAALQFRGHLVRYLSCFRNWSDVRRKLQSLNSVEAVTQAVDLVLSRQKGPLCPTDQQKENPDTDLH